MPSMTFIVSLNGSNAIVLRSLRAFTTFVNVFGSPNAFMIASVLVSVAIPAIIPLIAKPSTKNPNTVESTLNLSPESFSSFLPNPNDFNISSKISFVFSSLFIAADSLASRSAGLSCSDVCAANCCLSAIPSSLTASTTASKLDIVLLLTHVCCHAHIGTHYTSHADIE